MSNLLDQPQDQPEPILYLLWSNRHSKWWAANANGYADTIEQAGRYLLGDALAIVARSANHGSVDKATVMIAEPLQP